MTPNKRMQLADGSGQGTLDSVQASKAPQLMRDPLGRPTGNAVGHSFGGRTQWQVDG